MRPTAFRCQEQVEAAKGARTAPPPRCSPIRATGSSCKVKGSQDFLLGEMLSDLGCVNVADSNASLLEELSLEAILAADPDYIFVVLQGSDATGRPGDPGENPPVQSPPGAVCGRCRRGGSTPWSTLYTI